MTTRRARGPAFRVAQPRCPTTWLVPGRECVSVQLGLTRQQATLARVERGSNRLRQATETGLHPHGVPAGGSHVGRGIRIGRTTRATQAKHRPSPSPHVSKHCGPATPHLRRSQRRNPGRSPCQASPSHGGTYKHHYAAPRSIALSMSLIEGRPANLHLCKISFLVHPIHNPFDASP